MPRIRPGGLLMAPLDQLFALEIEYQRKLRCDAPGKQDATALHTSYALQAGYEVHPAEARAAGRAVKTNLSDQFVSRLVDRQDLQLEELLVAEPVGLPLHRLDLVVRPLQRARRDHHVVVGQQAAPVRRQR